MKKILSVLLAIALCAAFSICAFAEDKTTVSDSTLEDLVTGLGDLINAESDENDAALEEAIQKLYDAIGEAQTAGDVGALIDQLKDYAEGADVDVSVVFSDLGALQDVVEKFLVDGGFDLEAIKADLEGSSALSTLVGLYSGAYTDTPDPTKPTTPPDDKDPEPENPGTGDSVTGVAVALSILAISTAAVVVGAKKKED